MMMPVKQPFNVLVSPRQKFNVSARDRCYFVR